MIVLRSIVFNLWFYGLTLVLSIWGTLFARDAAGLFVVARRWARLTLGGLRLICGIDYRVTGREHLPARGPALIASMHQSAFDTAVWFLLVPDCTFVLKQELTRIPLFGPLLRRIGSIPVNRAGGGMALREMLRRADAAVAEGRQILIFPEGTRVTPGAQARLQPGVAALAARTGLPVIPVATDSGHHWGRRAFLKRPGTIHVAILPPLPAGLPREALLGRLEAAYAAGYASLRTPQPVDNSVGGAPQAL